MSGHIAISGTITCQPDDLDLVLVLLPDHIALSQQEPGCLLFTIVQTGAGACVFDVSERFVDQNAFDAHTARTRKSIWWQKTQHIPRNLTVATS